MLKVRAMGTVADIEWFSNLLAQNKELEVIDQSEILTLQGTKNYFRAYFQVVKTETNTSEVEE